MLTMDIPKIVAVERRAATSIGNSSIKKRITTLKPHPPIPATAEKAPTNKTRRIAPTSYPLTEEKISL